MKYVCMEDIENLAAQGKKELILDENTVLMDLARDMAHQLGISIVDGPRPNLVKTASPSAPAAPAKAASQVAPAPSTRNTAPATTGAKPKGCQHGSISEIARPGRPNSRQNSDEVMNQLVELVKQSAGKQSGS